MTNGAGGYFIVLCIVNNCVFSNNVTMNTSSGGGRYLHSGKVVDCVFINNKNTYGGCGTYCLQAHISRSLFINNNGDGNLSGGEFIWSIKYN